MKWACWECRLYTSWNRATPAQAIKEFVMSSISPIGAPSPPSPPQAAANSQPSALATDKATAQSAQIAAMEAAAQFLTAQAPQASAAAIKADQQAVSTAETAVATAQANVKADENRSTELNILV
jgi:hypothetical protein